MDLFAMRKVALAASLYVPMSSAAHDSMADNGLHMRTIIYRHLPASSLHDHVQQ